MKSIKGIKKGITDKLSNRVIARKIYLGFPTQVFIDKEEIEFEIKNEICIRYKVNYSAIQVCGSSKTGISFFNDREFIAGESDLDISIVDLQLYNEFLEAAHFESKGYTDFSVFPRLNGHRADTQFLYNLRKGYINPWTMPHCTERKQWLDFFLKLSNNYYALFKSINAGIYASEYFFESKQEECINEYIKDPNKYDKISGEIEGAN